MHHDIVQELHERHRADAAVVDVYVPVFRDEEVQRPAVVTELADEMLCSP